MDLANFTTTRRLPDPYTQPSLNELVKVLSVGNLRYPGGTKGNYFYIPNSTWSCVVRSCERWEGRYF